MEASKFGTDKFTGCSIRGLPIGVPFRTKILVPETRGSSCEGYEGVFIIHTLRNEWESDYREALDVFPDIPNNAEKLNPDIATELIGNAKCRCLSIPETVDKCLQTDLSDHQESLELNTGDLETTSADSVNVKTEMCGTDSHVFRENCADRCHSFENQDMQFKVEINEDYVHEDETRLSRVGSQCKRNQDGQQVKENFDDYNERKVLVRADNDYIYDNFDKDRERSSLLNGDVANNGTADGVTLDHLGTARGGEVNYGNQRRETCQGYSNFDFHPYMNDKVSMVEDYLANNVVSQGKELLKEKQVQKTSGANCVKENRPGTSKTAWIYEKPIVNIGPEPSKKPPMKREKKDFEISVDQNLESEEQEQKTDRDVTDSVMSRDNCDEDNISESDWFPVEQPKKVIRRRKRKKKDEVQEPPKKIKVQLQDHEDKYRVEMMESFERKHRAKGAECATEMLVCKICEKFKTKQRVTMETHLESHLNGELKCKDCDYVAAFHRDLLMHLRFEHKQNVHICAECGEETTGILGLKNHMGKVHDKPQFECKYCLDERNEHYASLTKKLYFKHVRKEHPDKLFHCPKCDSMYASEGTLKRHMTDGCEESGPKAYSCDKCGKTYATWGRLKLHIQTVHERLRWHKCPHCTYTAISKPNLTHHMHTHTGYHPIKCDQCTFSCIRPYQLTTHMRTHTGDKPYKCTQCSYASAWKVQLKDHLKVHCMPNTVMCDLCNIVFKDQRAYKTHASKEHTQDTSK